MSTYKIRVWRDGAGHWFEVRVDGRVVQTTWGPGSASAARADAWRVVENLRAKAAA